MAFRRGDRDECLRSVLYLGLLNDNAASLYLFSDPVEKVASQRVLYGRIADTSDWNPWAWTSRLGYVGSINLTGLSGGFTTNTLYGWWMRVYGANGFGDSFYYRWVIFSSLGSAPESGLIPFSSLGSEDDLELIAPPQPPT